MYLFVTVISLHRICPASDHGGYRSSMIGRNSSIDLRLAFNSMHALTVYFVCVYCDMQAVCDPCSRERLQIVGGDSKRHRVCHPCLKQHLAAGRTREERVSKRYAVQRQPASGLRTRIHGVYMVYFILLAARWLMGSFVQHSRARKYRIRA